MSSMESTLADILSLGGEIEVLHPTRLRQRVAAEAGTMLRRYAPTLRTGEVRPGVPTAGDAGGGVRQR